MVMLRRSGDRVTLATQFRIAVILLAVSCLTVSLATRYTLQGPEDQQGTAVKSQTLDAKRQHLLGDGLQFTAPASSFAPFQPPRSSVFAASAVVPPTNLSSESWLYNRPPPSC